MIKIVSKNLIKEDKVEEFKKLMKELVEKSAAEEGNIHYSLKSASFCLPLVFQSA